MGAEFLLGEHAGNSFDGALGRYVGGVVGRRDKTDNRTDINAAAVRREGASTPPGRQQNSEHVGVEVPMEVLLRHFLDRCEGPWR